MKRPGAGRPSAPSSQLSTAEYLVLVALLGAAIVATSVFVAWAYQQRGLLAPGTVGRKPPAFDPDYVEPHGGPDA